MSGSRFKKHWFIRGIDLRAYPFRLCQDYRVANLSRGTNTMRTRWLAGIAILLTLMIASPVAGGEWYGQFKPFTYTLQEVEIDPTQRASANTLVSSQSVKGQPGKALVVNGASFTIGHRFNSAESADLTLTAFKPDPSFTVIDPGNFLSSQDGNLITSILMAEFKRTEPTAAEYDSEFIGAELNYYRKMAPAWSLQGGLKYFYLGEVANSDSHDDFSFDSLIAPYGVDSSSHYFGAQVGADFAMALMDNLLVSGEAKLGGFVQVNKTTTLLFDNEGNSLKHKYSRTLSATVVKGKFAIDWRIDDTMTLSAGYMGVFMAKTKNSASLANDYTAVGFQKNDTDNVLYHGPIIRFNINW